MPERFKMSSGILLLDLRVCECVDPRVLFRWEKKLMHVRRPERVSDKQGMRIIFFDVNKVWEYSRPLHIVRLDRCKSLYKKNVLVLCGERNRSGYYFSMICFA